MNARPTVESLCVSMRPSMLKIACKQFRDLDLAEDAVSRTIFIALQKSSYEPEKPVARAVSWISGILRNVMMQDAEDRGLYIPMRPIVDDDSESGEESNALEALADEDRHDWCGAELEHEARYRMRFSDLTEIESRCLSNRLIGMRRRDNARDTGLTQEGVHSALKRAIKKVRANKMRPVSEYIPAGEHLFWLCAQATVYRAPTKTGCALAREKARRSGRANIGRIAR